MRVLTFDLHSHVNERNVNPKKYWERVQAIGIDVIAITEHAHIEPKIAFEKLAPFVPEGKILIPASELNCEFGHLLAYGKKADFYELAELFEKNVKFETCLDIAEREGLLLSIAHPWGFNSDSFGYSLGFERLEELVAKSNVGVEIYNGMIGSIANFIFETGWITKPVSFFDFLEKNRVARKTGLARLGTRLKTKIGNQQREIVERCSKAIELSQNARFVTSGSDAHVAERLGEGIMKIKTSISRIDNQNVFEVIKQKENIIWSGPLVAENSPGMFERQDKPFTNKEILEGARYAAGSLVRKVKEKAKEKTRRLKRKKE